MNIPVSNILSGPVAVAELLSIVAVQIMCYWLVSFLVARQAGTFGNAARFFVFNLVLYILSCVGLVAGAFAIRVLHLGGTALVLLIFVWLIVLVTATFAIVSNVYEIGCLGSLTFLVCAGILNWGASITLDQLFGFGARRSVEEEIERWTAVARPTTSSPAPVPALTPAPSIRRTPPPQITLAEPIQIPVMIGGHAAGSATLPRGTRVEVISRDGDTLEIRYQETVTTIPARLAVPDPARTPTP